MQELDELNNEPLVIAGRKIDGRTVEAKRFRSLIGDLCAQLERNPSASERMLLLNAATLATLCEKFTADLLDGKEIDQEQYRRNIQSLGNVLIKLGMAAKSRDVKKSDRAGGDAFGNAILEANNRSA